MRYNHNGVAVRTSTSVAAAAILTTVDDVTGCGTTDHGRHARFSNERTGPLLVLHNQRAP
jgi:hypothetical protein